MSLGPGIAVFSLIVAHVVSACECVYIPPCERIHASAAIFIGRVKDAGPDGDGPFQFEVEEAFKGVDKTARELVVWPGLCIAGYRPGRRYLVLAARFSDGSLRSGDCTGTVPVEFAAEDIRIIRAWAHGVPAQELRGRVAENVEDSMVRYEIEVEQRAGLADVELTAAKDEATFTATSDSRGLFRIPVPEPGRYLVRASFPGHSSAEPEYEFTVRSGECSEHNIGMWTDSKLSGKVTDSARHAVAGIPVEMMRWSDETSFRPLRAVTDANGSFVFTRVPKGEYLLGVNVQGLSSKLPYEPRYYPGVAHREMATPVRVGGPETLTNLNFQIGDRLPTRQIKVSVVWPDGRPVTNASITCESSRSDDVGVMGDWVSRWTDPHGEAVCEVLTDRDFEVEADHLGWSASLRPVQPIATRPRLLVQAGAVPVSLQITVDRVNDISDKEKPSDGSSFNDQVR